ncbi:Y-family DNA polymerase [Listeria monocytogenes]|uniref:Y-family DNA polymerase n=1 Tax=Listeria monocytogenes TaxID=1639 RepID=UPI000F1B5E6D|nr:Y-family DNA polymerase [Listeria monocytogenes]EAA0242920.1 Y-family DNA polymerase [Listeria monocytogenes]EAC3779006.1 Y-family DNA polymerase [Listeria monocytogenes]EAC8688095.1 Y-family DNA polymerase [Listeria monocytogenes]EAC8694326.1 Y-family DNA polymerase [Listeria monocytogenes]EAC8700637.1 Y-family DNA polymerase [Listeria monocytogenes]
MVQVEDYTHVPSRDILCVDVKSFFASVECVKRGLDPLQAFLVVMSNADRAGGLVLAASPQMKKVFRIKTGSRKFEVPEDDPRIIIAPPRMQLYLKVNELIQKIFLRYVSREDFHVYSIDEAFLDVTHSKKLFGSAEVIAKKIQADILKELKLYVTVGIGDNPLLAKLALDNEAKHQKSGIAEWRYKDVPETVWKIRPITDFWGIGKRTAFQLERMGIYSIHGLSQMPPSYLKKRLGIIGEQLYYHAHGIDYSRLSEKYKPIEKSYGKSQILEKDYHDPNQIAIIIQEMVEEVAMRLRNHHVDTSVIHLSCGYSRYSTKNGFSHQKKIMATDSSKELVPYFLEMFWKYQENDAVRSVAVSCGGIKRKTSMQLSVFEDYTKTLQQEQLERTIDKIRERYGFKALMHANSLVAGATGLKRSALVGGHKG